ncbi:MAG TPA: MFS transporter [Longimicrobiales bacterium]|nr:MFS transporter [Longimicrobiales bacterium]
MIRTLTPRDVASAIEDQPMTRFQVTAVGICMVLNAIDGFDVLAMAFAAPVLTQAWSLPPSELGVLFSSGLFGMAVGSMLIAPLADRTGRRFMTLASLYAVTAGMFLSAVSQNPTQLAATRVVTGLGIGVMLPSLTTVVAEYSSRRRRELCVSVMSTGYPVGATIGGAAAVLIIGSLGWRGIFLFGGLLSLTMIPVVGRGIPESLAFLATRRPSDALERINLVLRRLGQEEIDAVPEVQGPVERAGLRDIARARLGAPSAALWTAFFCVMLSFYFVLSWTPQLLVDAGLRAEEGISGGVLLNVGGIAGGLALGFLAARVGRFRIVSLTAVGGALAVVGFGLFATGPVVAMGMALVVGYFLFGSMVGLYALTPSVYPAEVRNTGTGLSIGVGRIGAILSPYLAGVLLEAGWSASGTYAVFALPLVVAAAATGALAVLQRPSTA